jgi:hypothetical protein
VNLLVDRSPPRRTRERSGSRLADAVPTEAGKIIGEDVETAVSCSSSW